MKELVDIQFELKAPKGQFNKFGGYKYRSCEDILEAVKPLCHKYGCTLTITDDIGVLGDRFYIKATATIKNSSGESESTYAYARESLAKKGMDDSQVTGATSSYARKYALNGLLCIDDTKDTDATNTHGKDEVVAQPKKAENSGSGNVDNGNAGGAIKATNEELKVIARANGAKDMNELRTMAGELSANGKFSETLKKVFNQIAINKGWS